MDKKIWSGILLASLCLLASSCMDLDKGVYAPKDYNVGGNVEKGPFINGSTIDMQPMNEKLRPLGTTFTSNITNNTGLFTFGSKELRAPFAQLTANGYFYHEVNGELSKGTLTLRAVVNLTDKSSVNVNILTHLKYQRILNLVEQGSSFDEANAQAQKELLTAFGLQRFSDADVSQYSVTKGTDESAALVALSSLLLVNRTEAKLTEYLAKLSGELAKDGKFSTATKQQMKKDRDALSSKLSDIEERLIDRYATLGVKMTVKDLSYYFDWDEDGIAGNEIAGSDHPVTLDIKELKVPKEGGTYSIGINSAIPVMLDPEPPIISGPVEFLPLYIRKPIIYTGSIDKKILKVTIEPATERLMTPTLIKVYDYVGTEVASLPVQQEGNPDRELFTTDGSQFILQYMSYLSRSIGQYNALDARYGGLLLDHDFMAPVSPYNINLRKTWGDSYKAISTGLRLLESDKNSENLLQASLYTLNALCFYDLVSFWGDVPYFTENPNGPSIPQTDATIIFESLTTNLEGAIDQLEDKKNVFATNTEECVFFSKDVPRIILADIYMYQGKFSEAKTLLKEVVSGRYYELEGSTGYTPASSELILGLNKIEQTKGASTITPVLTYTEVLLSLAECEHRLGNPSAARSYLTKVTAAKSISVSSDVLTGIKEARSKTQVDQGGYFAFLKRNNLAISELGLEEYQLILPFPNDEINSNPALKQNPGYLSY